MQRIMKQLFNGEICPNERTRISLDEYKTARNVGIQTHDAFQGKLCNSMKKEIDEMFSKDSDVNLLYNVQYFVDSLKVGARLIMEIL